MARSNKLTCPEPDHDWEARNALETLVRAEEIKGDQKLMGRVRKLADKRLDEIVSVKAELNGKG